MDNKLINRQLLLSITNIFRYFSVLTLTGPRQSGKTTLCRKLFAELPYYNLEDSATLAMLQHDPKAFLTKHSEQWINQGPSSSINRSSPSPILRMAAGSV